MGTINYGSSDIITLGVKPFELDDYLKDPYFVEWAQEWAQNDYSINDYIVTCLNDHRTDKDRQIN